MSEPFVVAGVRLMLASDPLVWAPTSFARALAPHLAARVHGDQRVLELGVGSGVLSILAGLLGADVRGLDINERAVELSRRNWHGQGLPDAVDRFRRSDRFEAILPTEHGSFDLVWANPPLLPALDRLEPSGDRHDFERAGREGRAVLDAMLIETPALLSPNGRILTIATSLQGWRETHEHLAARWRHFSILETIELALTDECTPPYVGYWQSREAVDGQARVWSRPGSDALWHTVWILEAHTPR